MILLASKLRDFGRRVDYNLKFPGKELSKNEHTALTCSYLFTHQVVAKSTSDARMCLAKHYLFNDNIARQKFTVIWCRN